MMCQSAWCVAAVLLHSGGSWGDQRSSVLGCEQLVQRFELLSLWHVKLCSCSCNRGSQVDMDDMDDMPHDDAMLEDFELERLHPLRYSPLTNAAASILFAPVAPPPVLTNAAASAFLASTARPVLTDAAASALFVSCCVLL